MRYLEKFTVNGLTFDLGSDWHFPTEAKLLPKIMSRLSSEQQSDYLFLPGDIFNTENGEYTLQAISSLLNFLCLNYKKVLFTPGNHDLRGTGKRSLYRVTDIKIDNLVLSRNGTFPLKEVIEDKVIIVGNLFYDMDFINPSHLGLNREDILRFYRTTNDGKYFIDCDEAKYIFKDMSSNFKEYINNHTPDIILTHALPHPSLVTFRVVPTRTTSVKALEKLLGIPFICNPEEDEVEGKKWNSSGEEYRAWWNNKSFMMGSDILSGVGFKDGMTAIYGHNHRTNNSSCVIDNKTVNFLSYQPMGNQYKEHDL